MGYSRAEIEDSLSQCKYDDVFATYLLLGRKNSDVSVGDNGVLKKNGDGDARVYRGEGTNACVLTFDFYSRKATDLDRVARCRCAVCNKPADLRVRRTTARHNHQHIEPFTDPFRLQILNLVAEPHPVVKPFVSLHLPRLIPVRIIISSILCYLILLYPSL